MARSRYDILGLGNAIVDIIAPTPDSFITERGLEKGAMQLIDQDLAEGLLRDMGETTSSSGGSAANTIIGAAQLGCTASFIGKVRDDELGDLFAKDIAEAGVAFPVPAATSGPTTGRCFILVTPDGQRTMNTFLGACQDLTEADVDADTVAGAKITYLEGYLWDPPEAKAAFVKAAKIAHEAGGRVALTLSDSFCVRRFRGEFLQLVSDGLVDILFSNEGELTSLYEDVDFDTALAHLRGTNVLGAITRAEKGCVVATKEQAISVPSAPIHKLVDTTGAGDLFAAGFLAGLVRDRDHETCARLGVMASAEIIQHYGARSVADLKALAGASGIAL